MLVVPTYLAPSPIEGIGLFAAAPIGAGTLIWTPQHERVFSPREVADMPPLMHQFVAKYGYEVLGHPGTWFCGLDNSRFMNHDARSPSAIRCGDEYVAARDLAAGAEITYDYDAGSNPSPAPA